MEVVAEGNPTRGRSRGLWGGTEAKAASPFGVELVRLLAAAHGARLAARVDPSLGQVGPRPRDGLAELLTSVEAMPDRRCSRGSERDAAPSLVLEGTSWVGALAIVFTCMQTR